jgi:hypothetical protein
LAEVSVTVSVPPAAHCEIARDVHRHASAQVRQPEGDFTITAIGGSEQLKECRVLGDREKLTITGRPPHWGEVPGKHPYLPNEGLHVDSP